MSGAEIYRKILLFRELEFPLKEIKKILDSPAFDPGEALERWGSTGAYQEYEKKTRGKTGKEVDEMGERQFPSIARRPEVCKRLPARIFQ